MQISFFDGSHELKITKPIRLIELFAGYGSQALALKYLAVNFEYYKISEWAVKSIQAYKDMHFTADDTDYSQGKTVDEIKAFLLGKISSNYNEPMTAEQIKRLSENAVRKIYNNMHATHNLGAITQIKAEDLAIVDTDKYCYIMTYSFPCQDLSSAGKMKGMAKGSGTRSAMLWEVERLLDELKRQQALPQVLLMETVPEVIACNNSVHFDKWLTKLEELGYKNYWQLLNSNDYGIPQNRNRCFMVSVLGDYYYTFPKIIPLQNKLTDFLEKSVDEKFYLSKCAKLENRLPKNDIIPTLCARDFKDPKLVAEDLTTKNKRLISMLNKIDITKVQSIDMYNQTTHDGIIHTIKTNINASNSTAVTDNFRIRKLTPRECFRLMGVNDDSDFENVAKNQSNASLYHLAGDSIVVNVLMAIFRTMIKI